MLWLTQAFFGGLSCDGNFYRDGPTLKVEMVGSMCVLQATGTESGKREEPAVFPMLVLKKR